MSRFPRWSRALAACAGTLLFVAGFAIGCGSSDDEPSATEGTAGSAVVDGGGGPGGVDAQQDTRRQARDAGPGAAPPSRQVDEGRKHAGKPGRSQPQRPLRGGQGAVDHAAARSCLAHFSRATCVEMAHPTPSTRIDEPDDCLKAMSREECEELLSAQQTAREHGESFNPEDCVANPTPDCEKALRPIVEAQRAAAREAGE